MSLDALPDCWTVWNDEPNGRCILVYRPDVFDTHAFPAPCLPTIYVTNRSQSKRPGASRRVTDTWSVKLILEPEIEAETESYDSRETAIDGAVAYARRFNDGEVDYRGLYQVPREDYFEKLDELTGKRDN